MENRPRRPISDIPSLGGNPQLDHSLGFVKPFGSARTYTPVEELPDGSARVHLSFDCTLQQLADGAFLTVADTGFVLSEIGLLKCVERGDRDDRGEVYGINGEQKLIFTRELIYKVAHTLRSRKKPINRKFLLL